MQHHHLLCLFNTTSKLHISIDHTAAVQLFYKHHKAWLMYDIVNWQFICAWWYKMVTSYTADKTPQIILAKIHLFLWSILHPFNIHTYTRLTALFPGLPRWAGTRKVKPIWISLKQETVSGSGISWAICKSAPHSRQMTTTAPHHSVFTGRMPFLPPNQQRQSIEGTMININ